MSIMTDRRGKVLNCQVRQCGHARHDGRRGGVTMEVGRVQKGRCGQGG